MSDELLKNQTSDSALTKDEEKAYTITPVEKSEIKKAIMGDEKAFESIFMGTYRYVFAVVRRYLKNDQDAYDAIQDTYTRVYKGISRLESVDSFYPWLHRIAENCAKDILASSSSTLSFDEDIEIIDDDKSAKSDVTADVSEVLKQLPEQQAELLIRVYYDKLRISEIARMQGVPATTLHNRLKVAKKQLKELLKIRGIDKPIYGGELVSVLSNAIRHIIGTELLSLAVAEEILHNVTKSQNKKGAFVVSAFARSMRNKAAVKIATILLSVSVGVAIVAAAIIAITTKNTRNNDLTQSILPLLPNLNTSEATDATSEASKITGSTDSFTSATYSGAPSSGTSSYDFYFLIMDDKVPLKGTLTNTERFGTHTENEELGMAVIGDTLYAVVKNNLVSLKNGSTSPTLLIKNFGALYTDSGRCLNIYNNKVYWVNENSAGNFVLNRCNIDGSGHYSVVFSDIKCTYLYKLLVAKDGVYFCAGKHGDYNYTESGTLYKTDHNFNILKTLNGVTDYTIIKDKIYYLYGKRNEGVTYSMDRETFLNPLRIAEDGMPFKNIYALGDYIVMDSCSKYTHPESDIHNDLKIIDTTQNKIVRAIYGEGGYIIDIKDINEADGTVLYRFNDKSMTLNIKTNETAVVSNHNGTTIKSNKYFIENDSLYYGNIQGTTKKKIY